MNHLKLLLLAFTSVLLFNCRSELDTELNISDNKVEIYRDSSVLTILAVTDNILNVKLQKDPISNHHQSLIVQNNESDCKIRTRREGNNLRIQTLTLSAIVNLESLSIRVFDHKGNPLFEELEENSKLLKTYVCGEDTGYSATHRFRFSEEEGIYGLGQHQDGNLNLRGKKVELFQHNMKVSVPVVYSSKGYALLWDNYSYSEFKDDTTASYYSEMGNGLDYYFVYGTSSDHVISGIRQLTGKAPMPPVWVFGLIQSKARYQDQDEILAVVKWYRDNNVPLDLIVQDWQYWNEGWWGDKEFDKERFPDPAGMIDELHNRYNVHYMISIWPCLEPGSEDYRQMDSAGFLYPGVQNRRYYDPFNPKARELFWNQTSEDLFQYGVDAWWCDATEPEINGWETSVEDYKKLMKPYIGSPSRYLNTYSLLQSKGVYEGQISESPDKRVFILTRSAFLGQQRYAAATWSGDISANWDDFRKQISAGLNFSITGIPYWTADIGAFFVTGHEWFRTGIFPEGIKDKKYHEFFVRMYQFGTFLPLFRVHGAQTPRELWYFGNKGDCAYDTQIRFNKLRYRLLPYIYSVAGRVSHHDYTMMRPLVMDFPHDKDCYNIDDQYMFGPSILVNPVTQPEVNKREVYLPETQGGWYDFWTGKKYKEGAILNADAPPEIMPLFIKAGSIIPLGPEIQYTTEKKADTFELRIYPGADGQFTLYEDDGISNKYLSGNYGEILIAWRDEERKLKIEGVMNGYQAGTGNKTFKIILVGESQGKGLTESEIVNSTIQYSGTPVEVLL